MPKLGQPFNPFGLFYGVFIPEALVRFRNISPGAKLCWGRLARYKGEIGKCYPSQEKLAGELGVSERNVRRYIEELRSNGLIRKVRRGLQLNNEYEFLWHEMFEGTQRTHSSGQDRQKASRPDRTEASALNRTKSSAPSERESLERESFKRGVARESTLSSPNPSFFKAENRPKKSLSRIRPEDFEYLEWMREAEQEGMIK